ncbi:unnamed protein product [Rotaria sp. Silwood1]|nr:unnamed protein product [Rotaria sp. Silwood1]CAF1080426.1 unnamed protein product [Rotaria sp. Silwood1]CAF3410712.1 unnamed protein product [Rotaria sp. Silwood1]CAF3439860.1 unnamed protein product [Rotaria sp. Silwood1]CAF4576365.1 unnamed protein product [Rotaria sp. Silwood1]
MDNNNNNNDHSIKHDNRSRGSKNRLKSSTVRDPNGSISTFRRFYQSGGRDYEQYRLWLQALSKSDQLPTSSNSSAKINEEPIDMASNISTIGSHVVVSSSSPPLHSQHSISIPRIARTYPLLKPMRHQIPLRRKSEFSLPLPTFLSSIAATTSFKPQIYIPYNYSHISSESSSSSSSSFMEWSVSDVSQFIEKHFPEKHIARKFMQQKIDGRTLPLLTEDHLTKIFKMKLGPALHLLTLISNMQLKN